MSHNGGSKNSAKTNCLPRVFVSIDESGCKQKVEILRNLRDHWAGICGWHTWHLISTGTKCKVEKENEIMKKNHTGLVFSPTQNSWGILPDKGMSFHHQTHLRSTRVRKLALIKKLKRELQKHLLCIETVCSAKDKKKQTLKAIKWEAVSSCHFLPVPKW